MGAVANVFINLGSPKSPDVPDVRRYLREFLMDPCVIDLPGPARSLLVNGIIAPIRSFKSSRNYRKIWRRDGFPLICHGHALLDEIARAAGKDNDFFLVMRYGENTIEELLCHFKEKDIYKEIRLVPLFPHFASSTTGSIIRIAGKTLAGSALLNRTYLLPRFHEDPDFIKIWRQKIRKYLRQDYDALVFSYHGIPLRQSEAAHPGYSCEELNCKSDYNHKNKFCYQASCYQSTKDITAKLDFPREHIHSAFQSRFGRNWLGPQTKDLLKSLAAGQVKKVLVICPSFVADCLETEVEIAEEYKEVFLEAGGRELTLLPSLNADPEWASFLLKKAAEKEAFLPVSRLDCQRRSFSL